VKPFRLDPSQVENVFEACQGTDIEVDAIVSMVSFDKAKLADHAELILAMLLELPTEFRQSAGGWSFLQACMDRHGDQWTGLHRTMARLFAMGIALGLVKSLMPRELWEALPGGMPYYVILDEQTSQT
jgi:hypothetical protein